MAKGRVISYRCFRPNSKQPRFAYVGVDDEKGVLPVELKNIIEDHRITEIDISGFGAMAKDLFLGQM
jgi:hypothetical protein